MKYLLVLLFTLLIIGCKKENAYQSKLDSSLQQWKAYKAAVNNSYSYVSYYGSVFGSSSETKISVKNGIVIGREYTRVGYMPNSHVLQVNEQWTENSSSLNTHTTGDAAIRLDQVYENARQNIAKVDTKQNKIYVEVDAQGLLSSCGYVPNGCQDDCFNGVYIKGIVGL